MMRIWARLKKVYLLLAVIIMLLTAWSVSDFKPPEIPPLPIITAPEKTPQIPESEYEESYYDIFINGEPAEQSALVLKSKQGMYLLPASILENANIDISKAKIINYLDQKFVSLTDFPLIKTEVDIETLSLKLTVPLEYFRYHVVDMGASKIVHPPDPPWGGYINYNFFATNVHTTNNLNAAFQLNVFSPYGVGNTSFSYTTQQAERPYVRLLTTWIIDNPEKLTSLSLGDTTSTATNWSGSVNFGGVKYGTNFNTQPTFITFPLPGFRGAAIVPTAMDLFINNVLTKQQQVAPGVYDITNIPMIDGYGNVKIVTKDILGRDQVVNAAYYISTTILKKDLVDYSVELGLVRQDLGIYSNNYSQALAAFTYGLGLTDSTTLQFHGEALSYEQSAGITLNQLISTLGIATGSIAFSKSYLLGKGGMLQLAFQRITQAFSFGFSTQFNSAHFTQQGNQPGTLSPKMISTIYASYPFKRINVGLNYSKQLNRGGTPSLSFISGSLSTSLYNMISLNFTMIHTFMGPGKKTYFLNLSYAIDENTYLNGTYNNIAGVQNKTFDLTRQLPVGPGYGYDISIQRGATNADAGSLSLQNDYGTYILSSLGSQGTTTNTLSVTGGLIYMNSKLKMSRTISGSFGYIQIPGFENIDIYSMNQLIGRTDSDGYAFVPNLLPFQETKVNIDPNTVPLNSKIEKYEDVIIPYRFAGGYLSFKVTTIHSAIFTLKQEDGSYVPEGADITVKDNENTFVSGANGQVFVSDMPEQFSARVIWGGGGCTFNVTMPKPQEDNPIPDIGIITCKALSQEEYEKIIYPEGSQTAANTPAATTPAQAAPEQTAPQKAAPVQPAAAPAAAKSPEAPAANTQQLSSLIRQDRIPVAQLIRQALKG